MTSNCTLCVLIMSLSLYCGGEIASAQPAGQPQTTARDASHGSAKLDMEPSLIVMNARGASLQGQILTLNGISSNSIVFADRPVRAAGHALTAHLLEEWVGDGTFAKDPPNATVSVLNKDGSATEDAVVELKNPHLDGDKLTFDIRVLEGGVAGSDGPASVFIDIIGLPWTPLSYAGVARRTARRAYWYGAAAAPHYPPYGYPPPYPPYRPYYPYAPYPTPYLMPEKTVSAIWVCGRCPALRSAGRLGRRRANAGSWAAGAADRFVAATPRTRRPCCAPSDPGLTPDIGQWPPRSDLFTKPPR